jgi:hypothetical protein
MVEQNEHASAVRRKRAPQHKIAKKRRVALKNKASREIRVVLKRYKLHFRSEPVEMFTGSQSNNSQQAYKKQWRNFAAYCELRGDYESLVVFHPQVPLQTPSVKRETIREYLQYKSLPSGTPLTCLQGKNIVAADNIPVHNFCILLKSNL